MSTVHRSEVLATLPESSAGALLMPDVEAGLTIRRLARENKLRPDTEVVEAFDDPMMRIRYCARRGVSTDDFAELLSERVTVGRPSHDRVLELLRWACSTARPTRRGLEIHRVGELQTRESAAAQLACDDAAAAAWQARIRRGSKLIPWVCQCVGVTLQASYRARVNARCETCGEKYVPKYTAPAPDMGAIAAAEEIPF